MEHAIIQIYANQAAVTSLLPITAGTVGAQVVLHFDSAWDGYQKTLVWRGSGITVDDTACTGRIPQQVLTQPHSQLLLGVYGVKEDKVLPTVWAELGEILPGADPSGDESTDPGLPVWAQLQQQQKDLVKKTDYATDGQAGVVCVIDAEQGTYGIAKHPDQPAGILVQCASEEDIDSRQQQHRPIVPKNLDYAVKSALAGLWGSYELVDEENDPDYWWEVLIYELSQTAGEYVGQVKWLYNADYSRVEAYLYLGAHPREKYMIDKGYLPENPVWVRLYPGAVAQ